MRLPTLARSRGVIALQRTFRATDTVGGQKMPACGADLSREAVELVVNGRTLYSTVSMRNSLEPSLCDNATHTAPEACQVMPQQAGNYLTRLKETLHCEGPPRRTYTA